MLFEFELFGNHLPLTDDKGLAKGSLHFVTNCFIKIVRENSYASILYIIDLRLLHFLYRSDSRW